VLLPDLKDTPRADAHPGIFDVETMTDIDGAGVDLKDTPRAEPHPDPDPPPMAAEPPAGPGVDLKDTPGVDLKDTPGVDLKDIPPDPPPAVAEMELAEIGELTLGEIEGVAGEGASGEAVVFAAVAERPTAPPVRLGVLSARRLDRRAAGNLRRIGKLEPGFGTWRRGWSLVVLVLIVAVIAAAFAAALDIVVSILSVLANHAISKSAGS